MQPVQIIHLKQVRRQGLHLRNKLTFCHFRDVNVSLCHVDVDTELILTDIASGWL